ncbi:MAG TPA: hypothetical protein VNG71_09450 [Pyrinomonadaceae bacterium]|nr:hypothetical protein [Pyrinomonadaceae bacterium]
MIKAEIERVPDERLDSLYSVVKEFARPAPVNGGRSLMSKLREISIDAPEDFAENIDLYLSGEKTIG